MSVPDAQGRAEEAAEGEVESQTALDGEAVGLRRKEIPVPVAPANTLERTDEQLLQHAMAVSIGGKAFYVSV
jgi:hypothetical protein